MQRRTTKQSRGRNVKEKEYAQLVKQSDCCVCGCAGPSIVDHLVGGSVKMRNGLERVHVGHWLLLPMCGHCDSIKTTGSRRALERHTGESELVRWLRFIKENHVSPPDNVIAAVKQAIPE